MKLNFKDIPKVCINLKRNTARKKSVSIEFKKHGINDVLFFEAHDKNDLIVPELSGKNDLDGVKAAAGILGCAMSHVDVIKMAKNLEWPAVCVFEDDVVFCDDFNERIEYIEGLEGFEFDILCLGGHFNRPLHSDEAENTSWKNILRVKKMGGTYGLIFTEKTYDFILRNWYYGFGADEFYGNHVYHRFNTFAFVPFAVGCAAGISDITESNWGYENIGWYYQQNPVIGSVLKQLRIEGKKQMMDCTFIIPVRVDSFDREFNFLRVIQYLCDKTNTNIFIWESDSDSKVMHLLKRIDRKNCLITHRFKHTDNNIFHRTVLLNEMLAEVKTEVTVNYDVDVMLLPEAYEEAREKIINEGCDLVYPYSSDMGQIQIDFPNKINYRGEDLFNQCYHSSWGTMAGHVQFFKTESYKKGYGENENFISYGAEDRERLERFQKLGYKVEYLKNQVVYHINHERGTNSSPQNPYFGRNEGLYYMLHAMDSEKTKAYYEAEGYIKKYKFGKP